LKQLSDPSKTQIKQVDVINVDMRQVMEESQQWLQKNITEEYAESKNISSDINISGQSKRKHQITYLAQQVMMKKNRYILHQVPILNSILIFNIIYKCL